MKYPVSFDVDFRKNPYKGLYVSVEGIDGSGKTTQVKYISSYLQQQGKRVVVTSEPTAHLVTGKLIRDIIDAKVKIPSSAFQFIYSADRVVNHWEIVENALRKGAAVVSHRTFWSAIAHGILDRNQEYTWEKVFPIMVAQGLLSYYHQFIKADLTFYLDVSAKVAIKRLAKIGKGKDLYEREDKLERVGKGYLWLVKQFPKEFTIIDGEKDQKAITKEIIKQIENKT